MRRQMAWVNLWDNSTERVNQSYSIAKTELVSDAGAVSDAVAGADAMTGASAEPWLAPAPRPVRVAATLAALNSQLSTLNSQLSTAPAAR